MLKRTMSIVLSVMMILSIFTIIPVTTSSAAPSDSAYGWHPVTADEVVSGDMVIITMATKNGVYGLSSANGSSSAPGAVLFTVLSNQEATQEKLTGSSDDISACTYSVGFEEGEYSFTALSGGDLVCSNTNNGVRIGGSATAKTYTVSDGYLKNSATSRYLGVFNSQDWRCYSSTSVNISDQTLQFWKYSEDTGTYDDTETPTEAPT